MADSQQTAGSTDRPPGGVFMFFGRRVGCGLGGEPFAVVAEADLHGTRGADGTGDEDDVRS